LSWLSTEIAHLDPGCFALVMATGIISNGFYFEGWRGLSDALLALNLLAFGWLILLTLVRATRFGAQFVADLIDPARVFGFFTLVAGSDVLGAGLNLRGFASAAMALWLFALILWLGLTYLAFAVLTFRNGPAGADIVHGGWLNAIVGTQSLVILGVLLVPAQGDSGPTTLLLLHALWGIGLILYGMFIAVFAQRLFFVAVKPDDLTPVLWIVMGAAAISTNAGSLLIISDSGQRFLDAMRPFIDGATLTIWSWATWWIPLLALFGIWKHGVWRIPLTYTPMLWSMVFPLGMYALATGRLSLASNFWSLQLISHVMIWVALAAWTASACGLVIAVFRRWSSGRELAAASASPT
jgi:tellurite resistance protein TehA-like permease